ncbi:hypothetical protein BB561_001731 [Smittium simulii]|uniref:Uncharacterized protein n=1 Tax=Smittium simulii TaxID=133385 RepID=A0A2T9YT96_9FUNG|nr:hypothetical protein BB561_001731 [Smittium simulii]
MSSSLNFNQVSGAPNRRHKAGSRYKNGATKYNNYYIGNYHSGKKIQNEIYPTEYDDFNTDDFSSDKEIQNETDTTEMSKCNSDGDVAGSSFRSSKTPLEGRKSLFNDLTFSDNIRINYTTHRHYLIIPLYMP